MWQEEKEQQETQHSAGKQQVSKKTLCSVSACTVVVALVLYYEHEHDGYNKSYRVIIESYLQARLG